MILALALTTAGFVLLVAEVLFPSFGTFGLLAAAAIVFADVVAADVSPTFLWVMIGVQVVGVPAVLKLAFWALPRLPFARGMVLPAAPRAPRSGVEPAEHLAGARGVATTDLRPSGTALFGDERRTVVAEAGVVERGTPVVVVAVEGYRVVVRPEAAAPPAAPPPPASS